MLCTWDSRITTHVPILTTYVMYAWMQKLLQSMIIGCSLVYTHKGESHIYVCAEERREKVRKARKRAQNKRRKKAANRDSSSESSDEAEPQATRGNQKGKRPPKKKKKKSQVSWFHILCILFMFGPVRVVWG